MGIFVTGRVGIFVTGRLALWPAPVPWQERCPAPFPCLPPVRIIEIQPYLHFCHALQILLLLMTFTGFLVSGESRGEALEFAAGWVCATPSRTTTLACGWVDSRLGDPNLPTHCLSTCPTHECSHPRVLQVDQVGLLPQLHLRRT